jgi:hypothetical protein
VVDCDDDAALCAAMGATTLPDICVVHNSQCVMMMICVLCVCSDMCVWCSTYTYPGARSHDALAQFVLIDYSKQKGVVLPGLRAHVSVVF